MTATAELQSQRLLGAEEPQACNAACQGQTFFCVTLFLSGSAQCLILHGCVAPASASETI